MKPIITPTVGRQVWFFKGPEAPADIISLNDDEPMAATVIHVGAESVVALDVIDHAGNHHHLSAVNLEPKFPSLHIFGHAEWMPYQKAQAEKQAESLSDYLVSASARQDEDDWREHIARVCHQVNKAYCESQGDMSQPDWEDAPEWQKASARTGVKLHLEHDAGPEASHASWMAEKVAEGWILGDVKDPILKTHPCMLPFDQLPPAQQAKDYIFRAIVHALSE